MSIKWYRYPCFNGLSFIRSMFQTPGTNPFIVIWGTPTPLSDASSEKITKNNKLSVFTHIFNLYFICKSISRMPGWLYVAKICVLLPRSLLSFLPKISKYQYLEKTHQSNTFKHTLHVSTYVFYFL